MTEKETIELQRAAFIAGAEWARVVWPHQISATVMARERYSRPRVVHFDDGLQYRVVEGKLECRHPEGLRGWEPVDFSLAFIREMAELLDHPNEEDV